jgi:hypothetical protein
MNFRCLPLVALLMAFHSSAADRSAIVDQWREKGFSWTGSAPLLDVGPGKSALDPHVSVKDPSFVFHEGAWHLFTTLRMKSGRVDMEYLKFKDWKDAQRAERYVLNLHDQYNCARRCFISRRIKSGTWFISALTAMQW